MNLPYIDVKATGLNIIRLCEERNISVRYLQEVFGFGGHNAIYKWRNGQSLPTVDNLVVLAAVLDVRMEDILIVKNREERNAASA